MSILEVKNLQYSYGNKKNVLRGITAQMEQGKMYAILGPPDVGKQRCCPFWVVWTALLAVRFCTRGRTLRKLVLRNIGATM